MNEFLKKFCDQYGSDLMYDYLPDNSWPEGWSGEVVEKFGGEGQGDTIYTVWRFDHPEFDSVYVKFIGWYSSYDGSDFQEYAIVTPKQRTITVYE